MKDRKINPKQSVFLINALKRHDPEISKKIEEHKYFLSEKAGYDIGIETASIDYLQKHLSPFQEGYSICFLDNIPEGKHFVKREKDHSCDNCTNLLNLLSSQRRELPNEFSLNKWFLGQKLNRPISDKESESDFLAKFGNDWFNGFRTCYEERICPFRGKKCGVYESCFSTSPVKKTSNF